MKRIEREFAIVLSAIMLSGCLTNYYERYYIPIDYSQSVSDGVENVSLRVVTSDADVRHILEDGCVPLGYSSFVAPYTSMSLAIDTAKKRGATLVLLDVRQSAEDQDTSLMYSSPLLRVKPNTIRVEGVADMYVHDAMFFRKRKGVGDAR